MEQCYENCPIGIRQDEQIKALTLDYLAIAKDVREIKERLLGRPSWIVTIIITFLSTLAFSALTFSFAVLNARL